ncbi:phage head closure protein [Methylocystis sp. JR02]|uniref:phage head closure protein n=1 Tax=Methylocystis sp. JR02 TaxID=3046284 RepID=UPI0024BA69D9|nr:phage head closure protein [Methylocystis sp. JR02]MDJ0449242.1 phage head closure protein [Methylocystis sp. JR02]
MKASDVGSMRERVTIQAQTQTINDAGEIATLWSDVGTCWARIKPVKAVQVALAGRDDAVREYDMTIRFRTDVSTNSQIIWRERRFDVQSVVDNTEQRQFLTARLREINA